MLASDYPFLDVMWTMLVFFIWILWFWLLFTCWFDIFRRHDLSGWGKAGWLLFTIILPFLGVFVYLIKESDGMAKRNVERAQAERQQFDDYVRQTAGGRRPGGADREGEVAARQWCDQPAGVRFAEAEGARLGKRTPPRPELLAAAAAQATIQPMVLVGDRDRDLAASALRRHFVQGRLSTAELADRVEKALGARTRGDLRAALKDLPLVWEDLPAGVHVAAGRVRRGMRRGRFFFALVRVWLKLNLVLIGACAIALLVGAPAATTLGVVLAAWTLAGFGVWRVWRRGASAL